MDNDHLHAFDLNGDPKVDSSRLDQNGSKHRALSLHGKNQILSYKSGTDHNPALCIYSLDTLK